MEKLLKKIFEKLKKAADILVYEDLYYMILEAMKTDTALGVAYAKRLSGKIESQIVTAREGDVPALFALHKKVLLAAAPYHFESYLLYAEWERDDDKKFYAPRRKALKPVVEELQNLAEDKLDLLAISLPPGIGKLVSDDTPVFTRDGWKTHGELTTDDFVVGLDGKYKKVEHIFPKNYADYLVEFTNGEKIKCHSNHEWYVFNRHRQQYEIVATADILRQGIETGIPNTRGHRYHFLLPHKEMLEGTRKDLPVEPYVLGAWLGDGTTNKGALTICNTDVEIVSEILRIGGYSIRKVYEQVGCKRYELKGLREDLQKLGMCQSRNAVAKYVPIEYLSASVEQRLELLAGLIDTDGSRKGKSQYVVSTINENIKDGVLQLIHSFGWRASVSVKPPVTSSSGVIGKHDIYIIQFTPACTIPCRVDRKKITQIGQRKKVGIKSIRKIQPTQGNCIQVEGGIYCVGKTMIPTCNSTLAIFYLTWLAGREPNKPILTGSHSNSFVRGVYDECLRILDPAGEYLWHDVFPGLSVSSTNAKDCRIDIDKRQRFETLEFTSIGTGNAGLYRAATLLYCDDLVSGIEVALSKERLDKLWDIYVTDLRQRKIGSMCKELHIATRWSVHDVIGRLEQEYEGNERAKFIKVPALNEKDESNFFYPYDVGFTTKFYHEQREIMDDASWRALYMNEPIEREGLLYHADELRRYFELPAGAPDAIIGVCDTKDKGKDYAFLPVAYVYGTDYYIADCICDNGLPDVVDARLVDILLRQKVQMCRFESNSAGGRIAEKIQNEVKHRGGVTHITTKFTTANKETKIIVNSAFVKEHCLFKDTSTYQRNSDYGKMMNMLCSYTVASKNKHDDVPDGMAMLADFVQNLSGSKVEVFKRPW